MDVAGANKRDGSKVVERRAVEVRDDAAPTVFVVDDDEGVRTALRWLIKSVGLKVETFASASEFLVAFDQCARGCLLLDVRMPGMSGLALQKHLVDQGVALPVIMITGYGDVQMAVQAMKLGAVDFIEKPFSEDLLLDCVQQAVQLDGKRRRAAVMTERARTRVALLSPRERGVLLELLKGKSNKEVAATLGISVKTVEVHRAHINEKLRVHSVVELVQTAWRGLDDVDEVFSSAELRGLPTRRDSFGSGQGFA